MCQNENPYSTRPQRVAAIREYLIANLFDGDDGGTVTARIKTFVSDIADVVADLDIAQQPLVKYEASPPRDAMINDIMEHLEELEALNAQPMGNQPPRQTLPVYPSVSCCGHEGTAGSGCCGRLDKPTMGPDIPTGSIVGHSGNNNNPETRSNRWCAAPNHGEPCPLPCLACAAGCNPEYTFSEINPEELVFQVRLFSAQGD